MVTQRDIAETISGLRKVSKDLREAANGKPLEGISIAAVPVAVAPLLGHAEFLDQASEELLQLIDGESPVQVEGD